MNTLKMLVILAALGGCKTAAPANDSSLKSTDQGQQAAESVLLNNEVRTQYGGSFVRLSDGVTSYDLRGPVTGDTVVLVHGVSGPLAVWDQTAPYLATQGYRVLRYDLYGRGHSDRLSISYDQNLFDRQLFELLDALDVSQPVVLVGSSMGAVIAAEFRNRHPERVRKIALLDPAGFPMKTPPIAKVINVPLIGETIMAIQGDKLLRARNRSYFHRPEEFTDAIAAYEQQLIFKGTRKAMLSTWRNMPLQSFDTGYAAVAQSGIPILLIWGREDEAIPFANADAARQVLEDCEFIAVADAGHLPQLEAAGVVNAALTSFIKQTQNEKM